MSPIRLAAFALLATTATAAAMDVVTDVPLSLLPATDRGPSETDVAPALQFAGPMPQWNAWDVSQVPDERRLGETDVSPALQFAGPVMVQTPWDVSQVANGTRLGETDVAAAVVETAPVGTRVAWQVASVADVPENGAASASDIMTEMAEADPSLDITRGADGEVDGMVMLSDVLFDYAVSDLKPEALRTLAAIASKLSGVGTLEVVGHTDDVGSVAFNAALGQDRADSVRAWLVEGGHMDDAAITAVSAGELEPLVPNESAEARALNRRVAFRVKTPDEG